MDDGEGVGSRGEAWHRVDSNTPDPKHSFDVDTSLPFTTKPTMIFWLASGIQYKQCSIYSTTKLVLSSKWQAPTSAPSRPGIVIMGDNGLQQSRRAHSGRTNGYSNPGPGDWTCASCRFSNFRWRTSCFRYSTQPGKTGKPTLIIKTFQHSTPTLHTGSSRNGSIHNQGAFLATASLTFLSKSNAINKSQRHIFVYILVISEINYLYKS